MVFLLGKKRRSSADSTAAQQQKCNLSTTAEGKAPEGIELEGSPGVYKSVLLKDAKEPVQGVYYPDVRTLLDAFHRGLKISEHSPCLGWRPSKGAPYRFISYAEAEAQSRSLGRALLRRIGLAPANNTFVAIYAQNCPQWILTALACIRHSMVVVPLYDTLGPDAASYILAHVEAEIVIVDDQKKLDNVLSIKAQAPKLKHAVLCEKPEGEEARAELRERATEAGVTLHFFDDLLEDSNAEEGKADPSPAEEDHPPKPEDTYIVCYTSGTTGTPKGVVLSHANLMGNLSALSLMLEQFMPEEMGKDGTLISYLPLSHVFEQVAHWTSLCYGYRIGYFGGDIGTLSDDMQALQPTLFPVVPRLLNRFNDTMKSQVARAGPVKRWLFQLGYAQKLAMLRKGIVTNGSVWDKLVFAKAQQQLGGKVRLIVTGSAPIAPEVLQDLRIAFGTPIIEGYGQTECTAMVTVTFPNDLGGGHCGAPAPCSLIKLDDVPEMNYYASDRKGEVLVKGPSVTKGYYRDPEKTAELFTEDGFLRTGDIGQITPEGRLRIIDRKKHIFKLAQGEYVAPEKIESVYVQCPLVQQVYVDGDSLERHLVAIVVPPERALRRLYAEQNGGDAKSDQITFEEICADKKIVETVLKEMQQMGKAQKLNSIEQVKSIHLETEPFSVENDLLTPTLKPKRPKLRQKYRDTIAALYGRKENGV